MSRWKRKEREARRNRRLRRGKLHRVRNVLGKLEILCGQSLRKLDGRLIGFDALPPEGREVCVECEKRRIFYGYPIRRDAQGELLDREARRKAREGTGDAA